jgi:two-component system response regulator MprA
MPAPAKILLVDDDPDVRAQFAAALSQVGYQVAHCEDGMSALECLAAENPALIILDVEMPRMNGWKTLAELRRRKCPQPILMVTHVNDVDSRVHGLDTGADDYIGKPCTAGELQARVRALLRRAPGTTKRPSVLHFGPTVVDLDKKSATRDGEPVRLTRTEYALLELLCENLGKPVSREQINLRVWGGQQSSSHTLDTHLWRLRQKLGDTDDEPRWIRNLPAIGFVLSLEEGKKGVRE